MKTKHTTKSGNHHSSQKDTTASKKNYPSLLLLKRMLGTYPESFHKLALKKYFLFSAILFCLLVSPSAFAAVAPVASESQLGSTEGQNKLRDIKKEQDAIKAKEAKAAEKKKRMYVYPEPDADFTKTPLITQSIQGTISAKNNTGLALEYAFDQKTTSSKEMWVIFNKSTEFNGVKNISELQEGDKVKVDYKETKDKRKKLFTAVTLIEKKPKELPDANQVAEEEPANKEVQL